MCDACVAVVGCITCCDGFCGGCRVCLCVSLSLCVCLCLQYIIIADRPRASRDCGLVLFGACIQSGPPQFTLSRYE